MKNLKNVQILHDIFPKIFSPILGANASSLPRLLRLCASTVGHECVKINNGAATECRKFDQPNLFCRYSSCVRAMDHIPVRKQLKQSWQQDD